MRLPPLHRLHDVLGRRLPDTLLHLNLVGPVRASTLDALRQHVAQRTGSELPALVEALLHAHDGSMYQPVSPSRPDSLLGAEDIIHAMRFASPAVPVIDRHDLDTESGEVRKWAIGLAQPDGPMWENAAWTEEQGVVWQASGPTLTDWLEAVIQEVEQFQPPAALIVGSALARWSACAVPTLEELKQAPLGQAYLATRVGRRASMTLLVKLGAALWGELTDFPNGDDPFPDIPKMTAELLRRRAQRSESLWALSPQNVWRTLSGRWTAAIQTALLEVVAE